MSHALEISAANTHIAVGGTEDIVSSIGLAARGAYEGSAGLFGVEVQYRFQ